MQLKNVLIDSRATCNILDRATCESLKQKGLNCKSRKCENKLFAYGQTKPIEVVGIFESETHCEESGEKCVDEFTVVEGRGKALLGKDTAEKDHKHCLKKTSSRKCLMVQQNGSHLWW